MSTAIIYDYVPAIGGGAERALVELAAHFKDGVNIYFGFVVDSPFSRKYLDKFRELYGKEHIHTGPVIKSFKPFVFRICNFLLPAIQQRYNLQEFDLVISYTSFLAHSITPTIVGKHLLYMNTPARFLWNLSHAHSLLKQLTSPFFITDLMRFRSQLYDLDAINNIKNIIAISNATKERIHTFYNRNSVVLYPPAIDENILTANYEDSSVKKELGTYFTHVSRVESYKNIELLLNAISQGNLQTSVIIMGTGPYLSNLITKTRKFGYQAEYAEIKSLGIKVQKFGPIYFTGYIQEELKNRVLANASASFSLNDEDFGITKVESLAVGTPVIGLSAGATPEILQDGKNGILFFENTTSSLLDALKRHKEVTYDKEFIRSTAKPFTIVSFHANLTKLLNA